MGSDKVVLIDPLPKKDYEIANKRKSEIRLPFSGREFYSGSPVALKDPIALEYIAGYLEKYGYETDIFLLALNQDEEILDRIIGDKSNILSVLISLHSSFLLPKTLELCKRIKNVTNLPIIVGDYHPSGDPNVVLNENVDYAVLGEGEKTATILLDAIKHDKPVEGIKGVAYHKEGKDLVINSRRNRLSFSKLPWPKRYQKILQYCDPGPLSYPPFGTVAQISFSRGCPYSCKFCASPAVWDGKISFRQPIDVVREVEKLVTEYDVNILFFCDLSFNANLKKAKTLCVKLTELRDSLPRKFYWHAMCNISRFDKELAKLMRRSGCRKIDFGVESVHDKTLQKIKDIQDFEDIKDSIKIASEAGILIRALLMIGYPWETEKRLSHCMKMLKTLSIDQVRTAFYVPFPGAEIFEKFKDKIIVDYKNLTADVPAIECDNIGREKLLNWSEKITENYYHSTHYVNHVKGKLSDFPEFKKSYSLFFDYLLSKEILKDNAPILDVMEEY